MNLLFHLLTTLQTQNTYKSDSASPETMEQPSFEDSEPKDRGDLIETNDEKVVGEDASSSGNTLDHFMRRISSKKRIKHHKEGNNTKTVDCLLYTSPSPRDS